MMWICRSDAVGIAGVVGVMETSGLCSEIGIPVSDATRHSASIRGSLYGSSMASEASTRTPLRPFLAQRSISETSGSALSEYIPIPTKRFGLCEQDSASQKLYT